MISSRYIKFRKIKRRVEKEPRVESPKGEQEGKGSVSSRPLQQAQFISHLLIAILITVSHNWPSVH